MKGRSAKVLLRRIAEKLIPHVLPPGLRLPARYHIQDYLGDLEPEMKSLGRITSARGIAIDVGSNEGFYSYQMAKHFSHVYAFEINTEVGADLVGYAHPAITVHCEGLSSTSEKRTMFIPIIDGLAQDGWAALAPYSSPDVSGHVEREVSVRTLDEFEFADVALIKIDVEGHELEVLQGAKATIFKSRPVVIVEMWEHHHYLFVEYFERLRYREQRLESLIGVPGSRDVYIFIPL